jgi:methyltransferase (TIGR00027 family)
MPPSTASRTALLVAAMRARASSRPEALCHDPWAARLAGPDGEAVAQRLHGMPAHLELWVALRTAYLDARVTRYLQPDPPRPARTQVVLLGAGLDTRAARLAAPGVRFFEVDAPSSAADKRARLAALPDYPVDAATYVSCDFAHEDFLSRLVGAGFAPGAPAVLIWEGVVCYLEEPVVRRTLQQIAAGAHPESVLMFDFVGKKMVERRVRHPEDLQLADELSALGEPLRFGVDDVLPLLYEAGFRQVRVTSFDELALNLTGTYDRGRRWRAQGMAEASVAAPIGLPP